MVFENYIDKVFEAIEFVMAVGSLLGIFGLLYAAAWWNFSTGKRKAMLLKLVVASLGLIVLCGLYTGIKYFHL